MADEALEQLAAEMDSAVAWAEAKITARKPEITTAAIAAELAKAESEQEQVAPASPIAEVPKPVVKVEPEKTALITPKPDTVKEVEPENTTPITPEPEVAVAPEEPTQETPKAFDFAKASVGGSLTLLKRGSGHKDSVTYAQEILVEAGYLQTGDPEKENYINPEHFGFMNGNVTVDAIKRAQQDMKDAGADIKVDGKIYTEGWAMLAALKENAGKGVDAAVVAYEQNLGKTREIVAREQAVEALASAEVSDASKPATELAALKSATQNLG